MGLKYLCWERVCTLYSNLCLYRYFYCCSFTFANSSVFRRLLPFDLCALLLSFLFTPFYFFSIFSDHNKSYTTTAALTVYFYWYCCRCLSLLSLPLLLLLLVYSTRPLGVFLLLYLTFMFMFYADNKADIRWHELQLENYLRRFSLIVFIFSNSTYLSAHLNCPSDPIRQMFIILTKSTAWVSHMQSRCETKDTLIFGACLFPADKPVKNFGLLSLLNLT